MSPDVRVVTVSVTPAEVSVLPVTRPSPGKCFAVMARPEAPMALRNVVPLSATTDGV